MFATLSTMFTRSPLAPFFCFPTQYTKPQHASVFQLAMFIGCGDQNDISWFPPSFAARFLYNLICWCFFVENGSALPSGATFGGWVAWFT